MILQVPQKVGDFISAERLLASPKGLSSYVIFSILLLFPAQFFGTVNCTVPMAKAFFICI
jgi:hypothetical protein